MFMYQITVMGCFVFSQDQAQQTDCVEVCNMILTKNFQYTSTSSILQAMLRKTSLIKFGLNKIIITVCILAPYRDCVSKEQNFAVDINHIFHSYQLIIINTCFLLFYRIQKLKKKGQYVIYMHIIYITLTLLAPDSMWDKPL